MPDGYRFAGTDFKPPQADVNWPEERNRTVLDNETDNLLLFPRETCKKGFAYFIHYNRLCGISSAEVHNHPRTA